jgi:hypothetical protein
MINEARQCSTEWLTDRRRHGGLQYRLPLPVTVPEPGCTVDLGGACIVIA